MQKFCNKGQVVWTIRRWLLIREKQISQVEEFSPFLYMGSCKSLMAAAAAKSLQSCPTLCDPHSRQPSRLPCPWDSPGKNTGAGCHYLLQCMEVKVKSLRPVRLLATSWTASYQTPPSMGFSRPEYWSGLPLPSPVPFSTGPHSVIPLYHDPSVLGGPTWHGLVSLS